MKDGPAPRAPEQNPTVRLIRDGTALIPNRNRTVHIATIILTAAAVAADVSGIVKEDRLGTAK